MWIVRLLVESLQLSPLTHFLMALTLVKYKLGRLLAYLPLSVSSASTDGGQHGDQHMSAGPALPGVCQEGFSSRLCDCFVDLSCAGTQTSSWGGGAWQVMGRRPEAIAIGMARELQGEEGKVALPLLPPVALPFISHTALL